MFKLDLNNFEESLKTVRNLLNERKDKLKEIVKPFLIDGLEKKKVDEICQAAKFVLCAEEGLKIVDGNREVPDFILSQGDKIIGLEIREFYTQSVEKINYVQKLFDDSVLEYKKKFDGKILVNFWLSENFNYKRRDKSLLIEIIIEFVNDEVNRRSPKKPEFIEKFDIQTHSDVFFHYNEGTYTQEILEEDIVLNAIAEKEVKINNYIEKSGTDIQWLLLVSSEVGSNSFDTYDFDGIGNVETKFEHVYLLKDFDCKIIKIK